MPERKYDLALVDAIREKQYIAEVDGIEILFKPVPDDDRKHVMDPRLFEIAANKKKMFKDRAKSGYRLSNERFRPDKVTIDLTTTNVLCDERLIPVNDDHMIDIYIYRKEDDEGREKLPVMIYLHGGGFTAGDMHLYANQMKYIAEQAHAVIIFPEYRLSPECPFPGPIDDCFATIQYVYENADELNIDREKIMVAGDSAGGSLTNACVQLDEKGIIKKIFELYPAWDTRKRDSVSEYDWSYDAYPVIAEHEEVARSRIDRIKGNFDEPTSSTIDNLYLQGKTEATNPLVSAICASDEVLKRFPRTIICNSEYDFLRLQSEYAAKKLKSLGVDVRLVTYCGCDHGFLDVFGTTVQAEEICLFMAEELNTL